MYMPIDFDTAPLAAKIKSSGAKLKGHIFALPLKFRQKIHTIRVLSLLHGFRLSLRWHGWWWG